MKIDRFSPPGNLTDFNDALAVAWSDFISSQIDKEVDELLSNSGIQPQFYNPSKLDVSSTPAPISWPAFPGVLKATFGDDPEKMFQEGEDRDNQDEYLEWSVIRENGKIKRVMFTCEGPEYWAFIAKKDPKLLVDLYTKIAGKPVPKKDLLSPGGTYRPRNKWNLQFAVHLIQSANNLGAEINIAAQATVLRRNAEHNPITDPIELIECSQFGVKERNSDPHIGDVVNQKARAGCSVALDNPIGLYIASLPKPADLKWKKPDGTQVGDYWKLERGDTNHIVRAVYEVPAGEKSNGKAFVVGDITIEGTPITFGGQIANALRIKLTGLIGKQGVFHNKTFSCPGTFFAMTKPFSRG